jgi:hypothetical protein
MLGFCGGKPPPEPPAAPDTILGPDIATEELQRLRIKQIKVDWIIKNSAKSENKKFKSFSVTCRFKKRRWNERKTRSPGIYPKRFRKNSRQPTEKLSNLALANQN